MIPGIPLQSVICAQNYFEHLPFYVVLCWHGPDVPVKPGTNVGKIPQYRCYIVWLCMCTTRNMQYMKQDDEKIRGYQ